MQILAIPQLESTRSHLSGQILRSRGFKARLAWQVASGDLEHDKLDALRPTHFLALTRTGSVISCVRLLPAMGPTMLETKFPELLEAGALFGQMVETSRFFVATSLKHERFRTSHLHHASLCLFAGIVGLRPTQGHEDVAIATNLRIERGLKRAKRPSHRLAESPLINETKNAACHVSTNMGTFERVCPRNDGLLSLNVAPAK